MKIYKYAGNVDKLIHQNKAECIDVIEGCLLDSLLMATKRGYIALIETFATTQSSTYTLYFSTDSGDIYEIWESLERNVSA